jgi:hypothetical protein
LRQEPRLHRLIARDRSTAGCIALFRRLRHRPRMVSIFVRL